MPLIDLHTHTHPLSHDSSVTPDDLIVAAKRAGLDGICLTEHDFFWEPDAVHELGVRHNFLVLAGVEVNTQYGHILVFGLERFVYGMHRIEDLVRMVADADGAMVAGHPYRRQLPFELEKEGDWSEALERTIRNDSYLHVNAIETFNGRGSRRQNDFSTEVCLRLGLPETAGSDTHSLTDVGTCATEFDVPIENVRDLINELKLGRCRPVVLRDIS